MRIAYADPPYLGCSKKFYSEHPEHAVYDTLEGHRALIDRLAAEFPDGWALSMNSRNLVDLLPLCPSSVRVMAWVKPFAVFKPHVPVAYAWEPVIVNGGRKRDQERGTIMDWVSVPVVMRGGGAWGKKPRTFCFWLFEVLGMNRTDELVDLFPGAGGVQSAWESWQRQQRLFA